MRYKLLGVALLSAMLALPALAAGIDGTWAGTVETQRGSQEITMTLKADGNTLTGSVSGRQGDRPIENGKIDGDKISFEQKVEFGGQSRTIKYSGTLAGEELKMTRAIEGFGEPREFTAKRK
jgi:hypothetical protein